MSIRKNSVEFRNLTDPGLQVKQEFKKDKQKNRKKFCMFLLRKISLIAFTDILEVL